MTRTAWFHCFAGTAGDMTLAALVHAAGATHTPNFGDEGSPSDHSRPKLGGGGVVDEVVGMLAGVAIDGYAVSFEAVLRGGIAATQAHVVVHHHDDHHDDHHDHHAGHHHRPYRDIRALVEAADLPERVRARSLATFALLAEVEGAMHRQAADEVEFHEVGGVDAIVDIVGACAALEVLGIDRIVCSPITVGQGTVRAAHGELPNPAPAVVELLARRHAPSRGIADHRELATPTGVALMAALADEFGPMPAMHVRAVGYGAGSLDVPGRPNVVQVVVGDVAADRSPTPDPGQPVQLFETNVDDVTGEMVAHTIAALLAAGAHDAWATPIVMKKGRPAFTVHALCDAAHAGAVSAAMVRETGTLGLRGTTLARWPQHRTEVVVHVQGHPVRVKVAEGRVKVEHDDAAAAAAALGLPLREVLAAAAQLASA